ncbi:hypothetical protein [Bradyrhizobium arachidis]|uniref:Uncharacterized protein n=1 Tax=Bradyrhizobium arachidis TaxID=858423 RepID=A0AAE7TI19_9BRAD|nr:hypothetical protein [Bradyrhizobium arachidis]QOZ69100.1 hypothetical protein WN72_24345 [Bradyrhizobium arachidis]SFV00641.1 hypothetical protein SAMN05192541_109242 [Bradyrhizobium arachidis]
MKRWLERLGRIATVAGICGTVAWLVLLASSPQQPDAAHPERYAHRHSVRYVSAGTDLALQILLGSNFMLALVALGCHLAASDRRGGM